MVSLLCDKDFLFKMKKKIHLTFEDDKYENMAEVL